MKIFKDLTDYDKIKQVIDSKGISVSKAEGMAGLGGSTISKLKKRKGGDGSLHEDNVEKFLRTFEVNPIWWETGEGEMFLAQTEKPGLEMKILFESMKGINKLLDHNKEFLDEKRKDSERLDKASDRLDEVRKWAFIELEKLHTRLGISKESQ